MSGHTPPSAVPVTVRDAVIDLLRQFGIDRVFVTAAVPEPGTWAMMLLGFGAIGFSMRRRRHSHIAAMA